MALKGRLTIVLFLMPITLFYALVWLYPLVLVFLQSFGVPTLSGKPEVENYPTMEFYREFASSSRYLTALWFSFWNSLVAVLVSILVGYLLALVLFLYDFRGKRFISVLYKLPLFVPYLVAAFMWWVLLVPKGYVYEFLKTLGVIGQGAQLVNDPYGIGIIVANTWMHIPFVALVSLGSLKLVDPSLVEAARVLGADMRRVLRHIYIPLTLPGILASLQLIFLSMFGGFSVAYILGASFPTYMSVTIYEDVVQRYLWSIGSVQAVIYLISALVITYTYSKISRKGLRRI